MRGLALANEASLVVDLRASRPIMSKNAKRNEMLTAAEAIEEYREIAAFLKWDKRMIGVFCQGNLVVGRYDNTLKEWVVRRDSLECLIEYVKGTFQSALQKHGK